MMSALTKLVRLKVPLWPLRFANVVGVPGAILAFGSYRVWQTAATPFDAFSETLAVVAVTMLWPVVATSLGSGKPAGTRVFLGAKRLPPITAPWPART